MFGPLTGVGTDLLVSRPVDLGNGGGGLAAFAMLPRKEQQALQEENQDAFVDPADLGSPGEHFTADSFLPATQLTFPAAVGQALRTLPEVETVGRALTVLLVHAEGEVPEQTRAARRRSAAATSRSRPRRRRRRGRPARPRADHAGPGHARALPRAGRETARGRARRVLRRAARAFAPGARSRSTASASASSASRARRWAARRPTSTWTCRCSSASPTARTA